MKPRPRTAAPCGPATTFRPVSKFLTCVAVTLSLLEATGADQIQWEPVGLSGGGGMFTPAISPADSNLMMLNCDMSAAYLSEDGGRNWRMIHLAQLHIE